MYNFDNSSISHSHLRCFAMEDFLESEYTLKTWNVESNSTEMKDLIYISSAVHSEGKTTSRNYSLKMNLVHNLKYFYCGALVSDLLTIFIACNLLQFYTLRAWILLKWLGATRAKRTRSTSNFLHPYRHHLTYGEMSLFSRVYIQGWH